MIYGQHGDLEAALKPFLRAAELSPQSPQVQYNLALTYFQLNRFEDARAPLEQALKRWPDLFPLNALYGAVLAKLETNPSRPMTYCVTHIELNPQDSSNTQFPLCHDLEAGREESAGRTGIPAALRYYEEAAKLRPEDPDPHRRMAQIYTQMGKPQGQLNSRKPTASETNSWQGADAISCYLAALLWPRPVVLLSFFPCRNKPAPAN